MKQNVVIILASGSPRRRELLSQIGLEFTVRPSDAEELITKTKPSDIVMELASTKADAIWQQLTDAEKTESIVLGADTIVVWGDEILGKPKDKDQAREMFLAFFCAAHGLASLLANNSMEYDEGQCGKMLENVFLGMTAVRKGR